MSAVQQKVLIIDFGSQYTQLIARRIRALHVFCEIHAHTITYEAVQHFGPAAIILSGGPASVTDAKAPDIDARIIDICVPILAICYGQQLLAKKFGGRVVRGARREYGGAQVHQEGQLPPAAAKMFAGLAKDESFAVWMSHSDHIEALPQNFVAVAATQSIPYAAIAHQQKPIIGLQFHPEVSHTPRGLALIEGFVLGVAAIQPTWTMATFLKEQVAQIKARVGPEQKVICALSGGVDSSVVAALLARALGRQVLCIFVDNGLLRRGEVAQVVQVFGEALGVPLQVVDARQRFLQALKGVTDPEQKRKIIGRHFIEVFEEETKGVAGVHFLAQGTLYPDVIESISYAGPSATIKSHHNVGGLPQRMNLQLIEPLRALFKDEVRDLGAQLGLPHHVCWRQPFPGPGLAVRILGEVTAEQTAILRHADAIVEQEIRAAGLYHALWQAFAVLLPVRSVGVMGDARTFEQTIALRCVESNDGMTADWARLPYELLAKLSQRVINEVHGINRVVYDISSKPPATIEWE